MYIARVCLDSEKQDEFELHSAKEEKKKECVNAVEGILSNLRINDFIYSDVVFKMIYFHLFMNLS